MERLVSAQWGRFVLQGVKSNTLDIWCFWLLRHVQSRQSLKLPAPFSRVLLMVYLRRFRRRLQSCQQTWFYTFCASWPWGSVPNFWISLPLSPSLPALLTALSFWISLGVFVCCFPVSKRLRNSWRDCSTLASNSLGSFLPAFLFRLSMANKVSVGSLPCSPTVFLLLTSSFVLWGGEN